MNYMNEESLYTLLMQTAMEELGVTEEAASRFAQIATEKVTGFFFRFDHVPECLVLKDVKFENGRFIAEWESLSTHADCPKCGKTSNKQYSSHLRSEMVQDVGINGFPLWHRIWRKKYNCLNDDCEQTNFLEGFPGFIEARYSRMTARFADHVIVVSQETSNRAAARILKDEGAEIEKDAINQLVLVRGGKQIEQNLCENAGDVVNVGIDDINFRKGDGSTSCLVVVDLSTGQLLCIARGTTGQVAKNILSMFPNLKIVGRDRATAMASAVNNTDAISVADRFHIVDNMHTVIKQTLLSNMPSSLHIPIGNSWTHIAFDSDSNEIMAADIPSSLTEEDIRIRIRMAQLSPKEAITYRNTLRILELTTAGKHAEEIAVIIGLPIDKVRSLRNGIREEISKVERRIDEYCKNPEEFLKKQKSVGAKARHSSKSKVAPFHDTVVSMHEQGNSHWAIHEAICKQGFKGSHSTVDNYIIKLSRETSIENEMKEKHHNINSQFASKPVRPERIAVCILSVNTVYQRVLAKIEQTRPKNTEKEPDLDNKNGELKPDKGALVAETTGKGTRNIGMPEKVDLVKKNRTSSQKHITELGSLLKC
jgi:DNA-binding CsgD family transcriptional regulator